MKKRSTSKTGVDRCTKTERRLVGDKACKLRLGGGDVGVGSGKLS